jgi:hypothetical protein
MSISVDLGLPAVFDTSPIDVSEFKFVSMFYRAAFVFLRGNCASYFLQQTSAKMSILLQQLLKLPVKPDDSENVVVTLPKPITPLPREKPVSFCSHLLYCHSFLVLFLSRSPTAFLTY